MKKYSRCDGFESYVVLFSSDILPALRISQNLQFHCHQIIIANAIVNGSLAAAAVTALADIAATIAVVV